MGAEDVVATDAWFLYGSFWEEAETQLGETPTLASPSPCSFFSVRLSLGDESGGWPAKLMNQIRKRNQLGKNSFIADVKAGTDGDEDNKIQLNQATNHLRGRVPENSFDQSELPVVRDLQGGFSLKS
ncbi:hypothetical protein NC652_041171 [Populus alba x Populus x berolinensis]|nr:hypothetical protein NC652_041171 [Populus alba x Populus x berolinensis]